MSSASSSSSCQSSAYDNWINNQTTSSGGFIQIKAYCAIPYGSSQCVILSSAYDSSMSSWATTWSACSSSSSIPTTLSSYAGYYVKFCDEITLYGSSSASKYFVRDNHNTYHNSLSAYNLSSGDFVRIIKYESSTGYDSSTSSSYPYEYQVGIPRCALVGEGHAQDTTYPMYMRWYPWRYTNCGCSSAYPIVSSNWANPPHGSEPSRLCPIPSNSSEAPSCCDDLPVGEISQPVSDPDWQSRMAPGGQYANDCAMDCGNYYGTDINGQTANFNDKWWGYTPTSSVTPDFADKIYPACPQLHMLTPQPLYKPGFVGTYYNEGTYMQFSYRGRPEDVWAQAFPTLKCGIGANYCDVGSFQQNAGWREVQNIWGDWFKPHRLLWLMTKVELEYRVNGGGWQTRTIKGFYDWHTTKTNQTFLVKPWSHKFMGAMYATPASYSYHTLAGCHCEDSVIVEYRVKTTCGCFNDMRLSSVHALQQYGMSVATGYSFPFVPYKNGTCGYTVKRGTTYTVTVDFANSVNNVGTGLSAHDCTGRGVLNKYPALYDSRCGNFDFAPARALSHGRDPHCMDCTKSVGWWLRLEGGYDFPDPALSVMCSSSSMYATSYPDVLDFPTYPPEHPLPSGVPDACADAADPCWDIYMAKICNQDMVVLVHDDVSTGGDTTATYSAGDILLCARSSSADVCVEIISRVGWDKESRLDGFTYGALSEGITYTDCQDCIDNL